MNVSIIIPVYNEEDYLPACLDAVARQTVKPSEVIVVDNNCSDGTVAIAKRYPFVRVIQEKRQGTVFARNTGFQAARGTVMARIDADTRIPKDWTASVVKALHDKRLAGVTGPPAFYDAPFAWFFNTSQVLIYQRFQKLLTGSFVLWGANMAIRRDAWQKTRRDCTARLGIDEDIDLSFVLHKQGYDISYVPGLRAQASLQRGRADVGYTMRYLASWPQDYWLHRMYLRGALIALLICVGMIFCLPFLFAMKLRAAD